MPSPGMLSHLPIMTDCILPTLYVIGNGFDIAHDIESRYSDFRNWVANNGNDRFFTAQMDTFFSNRHEFWYDVETALGEYDEDSIIGYCLPEGGWDYDHPTRTVAAIEDSPAFIFNPVVGKFVEYFHKWVDSISLHGVNPLFSMPMEAKYLTFNYTETLEKVYCIPEENVLHIHGKRMVDKEYIVGHSNYRDEDSSYGEHDFYFINDARAAIIRHMNGYAKPVDAIISDNDGFFSSLSDIKQVIVIGHSLNAVDLPYVEKIKNSVSEDSEWIFTFYGEADVSAIKKMVSHLSINKFKVVSIDDIKIGNIISEKTDGTD